MKYIITLPQNIAENFHELTSLSESEWFVTSDPETGYLGSGGGTVHALLQAYMNDTDQAPPPTWRASPESSGGPGGGDGWGEVKTWLSQQKRIIIHAGGQSRRLPAYGPSGKILTPMPVLRWKKGQKLNQTLLNLQLPLLNRIADQMPEGMNTLIASGDVLVRASGRLPEIPNKDVVAFGHWVSPELASRHGVFFCDRYGKNEFQFMLQKPTPQEIKELLPDHLFMIDVGVWGLSDAAVGVLFKKGMKASPINRDKAGVPDRPGRSRRQEEVRVKYYDLYGDFGLGLGNKPRTKNQVPNTNSQLTSEVLPLPQGEFYHFGTSRELISSNLELQNRVHDQREIIHRQIKAHPAVFIQNSITDIELTAENANIWIENSHIGKGWKLSRNHIITGVPENNWEIELPEGMCLDVVPVEEEKYALRVYDFDEKFTGKDQDEKRFAIYQGTPPPPKWRGNEGEVEMVSAAQLLQITNLSRLITQREKFRLTILPAMAENFRHSIFYHLDLEALAKDWIKAGHELPAEIGEDAPEMIQIHDAMWRGEIERLSPRLRGVEGENRESGGETKAFHLLQKSLITGLKLEPAHPKISVHSDQVVWGRSPVRLDLGGGWTDTPPNCILNGGKVVNVAVNLNGQAPLQVFIKPTEEPKIILRSIDLGLREEITNFDQLVDLGGVGGAFSIPKAALQLAGVSERSGDPDLSGRRPRQAGAEQASPTGRGEAGIRKVPFGLELSMLVAVPKGSGLGTSSILAATVLGSLSDFFGLGWDRAEVGRRTLALEQILTTGGGWQDQFGGIYPGLKMLETRPGFNQSPEVSWLPGNYFTDQETRACLLLYYTGITRMAKSILGEIVRGMFLNSSERLQILDDLGQHAEDLKDNLLKQDWAKFGHLIDKSWKLNQALDNGTNPPDVQEIIDKIKDYVSGQKLLGAGGGGYMFMVAKNPEAAIRIKDILRDDPPNERARFVDFDMSVEGMVVTRS